MVRKFAKASISDKQEQQVALRTDTRQVASFKGNLRPLPRAAHNVSSSPTNIIAVVVAVILVYFVIMGIVLYRHRDKN
jgi:hypothetical protein